MQWFKKCGGIVECVFYLVDVVMDINLAAQYFTFGYIIWGSLTLACILIPLVFTGIAFTLSKTQNPILLLLLIPVAICAAPIITFYYLVMSAVARFRGDDSGDAVDRAVLLKLLEAMMEALPQAAVQAFIILIHTGEPEMVPHVGVWELITFAKSLLTLTYTVSSSAYLFNNADSISRCVFFIFGLMAVAARIMLPIYPFLAMLAASFTMWLIKRYCGDYFVRCGLNCVPLADVHVQRTGDLWGTVHRVMTWLLTATYNCFTPSGLLISAISLAWTLVAWFPILTDPHEIIHDKFPFFIYMTIALISSTVSFVANLLLVLVPCFRCIRDHWLNINEEGKSTLY